MNDILKQRLVGALILVALGVVFWPLIFVQPGPEETVLQPLPSPSPGASVSALEAADNPAGAASSQPVRAVETPPQVLRLQQILMQKSAPVTSLPRPHGIPPARPRCALERAIRTR